jgi:hypothetical protein
MIDRTVRWDQRTPASEVPGEVPSRSTRSRTGWPEQALIFATVLILPVQNHFPSVAGMSVGFLIFAAIAGYVIVDSSSILGKVWHHPCFIAAYAFIGVSILLEFSSPLSRYDEVVRFAQMIGGAVCLAVLCRDRAALTAGLYGYIAAALWVSAYLYLTSYGVIQEMGEATSFHQASKVRAEAFADKSLQANVNALAFVCSQGAIVAFALALVGQVKHRRILLLGIATFCLVAAFLPMSRGAAVISLVSFGAILYVQGVSHGKTLIFAFVLGLGLYIFVPDAVWSRMAFSTESRDGKMEGRAWIYTTALNRLPEYVVAGVGAGNYYNKWGFEKGFGKEQGGSLAVYGAHNSLLQITIFWGLLGLLMYLWIIWCVYRSIPLRCGRDELSLALVGIMVSLSLWLMMSHGFSDKSFACGLGMLVGARRWIWPTGIVSAVEVGRMPAISPI